MPSTWTASSRSPSRRRGRTCGSVPGRTGTSRPPSSTPPDAARRRPYVYHAQWQLRRARRQHDHVLEVARRLPAARRSVRRDLRLDGFGRATALALAFRLLDLAYFRAGGEGYAERNGSSGLATLRREHVQVLTGEGGTPDAVRFRYPATSGQLRGVVVEDAEVAALVGTLLRRRGGGPELLAWRDEDGWHDLSSAEVGADVKRRLGEDTSGEGLPHAARHRAGRTRARGLADSGPAPGSARARRRVVAQVVRDVSEELGNTPAVCRASSIDPRVVDLWEHGTTIRATRSQAVAERETLALLAP